MTKQTQTVTKKAASRRPTCKHCKVRFTTTIKDKIYCSRTCKDKALAVSRRKDPLEKAMKCAFFYYLARECSRAGTLEILRGHTVETLSALHSLYKANMRYNGYGDRNDYELSHISPVSGVNTLGLLFADNLVSAPKFLNRAHGTKHFGHGMSISRATLNTKHAVDKENEKESSVVQRVLAYLGKTVVLETIKACKIKPTQRCQLTQWIVNHYDESNADHVAALPDLDALEDMKTKQLQALKTLMTGKESSFMLCEAARVEHVMSRELSRLSLVRPELEVYAYAFEDALTTQAGHSLFTTHHAQMLFDVLHGKSIEVMGDTLQMVIAENTLYKHITYVHGWAQATDMSMAAYKALVSAPVTAAVQEIELIVDNRGNIIPLECHEYYSQIPF